MLATSRSGTLLLVANSVEQKLEIKTGTARWPNPRPELIDSLTSSEAAVSEYIDADTLKKIVIQSNPEILASFATANNWKTSHPIFNVLVKGQALVTTDILSLLAGKLTEAFEFSLTEKSTTCFGTWRGPPKHQLSY
jgi:hypothetical protein